MAHGDPQLSPWYSEWVDTTGKKITLTVNFNETTRALTTTVIHRDTGCRFNFVVFDDPNDVAKAKKLAAPIDGAGDRTYTAAQIAAQGLTTIEQAMALQITVVP
jgi:hypothetical protein